MYGLSTVDSIAERSEPVDKNQVCNLFLLLNKAVGSKKIEINYSAEKLSK
jgi:hypothetical protein